MLEHTISNQVKEKGLRGRGRSLLPGRGSVRVGEVTLLGSLDSDFCFFGDHGSLGRGDLGNSSCDRVNVFEVTAQITTLCEHLLAEVALVRAGHRVLAEMVSQVTTLAED